MFEDLKEKMQLNRVKFKNVLISLLRSVPVLYVVFALVVGISDFSVPDNVTIRKKDLQNASVNVMGVTDSCTVEAKLFGVLPIKDVNVTVVDDKKLAAGGDVFGVKFFTKGVMIIKQTEIETSEGNVSPSKKAGLVQGDIIISIDGKEVNTVEDVSAIVEKSYGRELEICYERDGCMEMCSLEPVLSLSDKKYKTGLWVRDSTAGIGTVTFYNPDDGSFGGLGHGICDVDTGKLMPLLRGSVVDVEITDVVKGKKGLPGEIKGSFDNKKRGVLTDNTDYGVYGVMDVLPDKISDKLYDVALKDEVKKSQATILSSLDSEGVKEYSVEIEKIMNGKDDYKNFVIKVTDEDLLEKSGGIVQGMSGSPIIQNGKLVGAVTHVFVNDPTRGYGIFIENMLAEAEKIK